MESDNKDYKNGYGISNGVKTNEENDLQEELITILNNPPLTVHQFQLALYERIKRYGRISEGQKIKEKKRQGKMGIVGVWNAIAPNLKYNVNTSDKSGKYKITPRLTKSTFHREVNRLKSKSPTNEHMSFGMRGNILLLLNIMEILEIKNVNDLLGCGFPEPNIKSMIIASNINTEELQKKIDTLQYSILSSKNKPRLSKLRICREWGEILYKLSHLANIPVATKTDIQGNISWNYNILLAYYSNNLSKEIQLAIYGCSILNDYKEYFYQDTLLHQFILKFNELSYFSYNINHRLIILAPLYMLYFFLICQRKFIRIFLSTNQEASDESYSPFIHKKYDMNGKEVLSGRVKKTLNGKSLAEYLNIELKEMQNTLKRILILYEEGEIDIEALPYTYIVQLMNEIFHFFMIFI